MNKKLMNLVLAFMLCISLPNTAIRIIAENTKENIIVVEDGLPNNESEENNSTEAPEGTVLPEATDLPESTELPESTTIPGDDILGEVEPTETPLIDTEAEAMGMDSRLAMMSATRASANEVNVATGPIVLDSTGLSVNGAEVTGYDSARPLVITGTIENTDQKRIYVYNATADLIFRDLTISTTVQEIKAVEFGGSSKVNLTLEGTNRITNNGFYHAALTVGPLAEVTIDGTGSLTAEVLGETSQLTAGCGIGGSGEVNGLATAGNITINAGTITAKGGCGIGGGNVNAITINGGNIIADASEYQYGAGIGSVDSGKISDGIYIRGGNIEATAGLAGAGIGYGSVGTALAGIIEINGNAVVKAQGGIEASGIGGGRKTSGTVTIKIGGNANVEAASRSKNEPDIGTGSTQGTANGVIEITGGTITTKGKGVGIGSSSVNHDVHVDVSISNAKIITGKDNMYSIYAMDLSVKNATITANNEKNNYGISIRDVNTNTGKNDVIIEDSTITGGPRFQIFVHSQDLKSKGNTMDKIVAIQVASKSFHDIGSNIKLENVEYSRPILVEKNVVFENTTVSIADLNKSQGIWGKEGIDLLDCKIDISYNDMFTGTAYAIRSDGDLISDSSDINVTFPDGSKQYFLYAKNITLKNDGNYTSNGVINSLAGGKIDYLGGYSQLSNPDLGMQSATTINVLGGYIDAKGSIKSGTVFNLGAVNEKSDAIVFAKNIIGNQSKTDGVLFLEELSVGTTNPKEQFVGNVYGDVILDNVVEENGTQFVMPSNYTLFISDPQAKSLTIPTNVHFVNNGIIENQITVGVVGSFTNEEGATLNNYNKGNKYTFPGGDVNGGTLVNKGNVYNEVFVGEISLDGAQVDMTSDIIKTVSLEDGTTITGSVPQFVFAKQGQNEIYWNDTLHGNVESIWKYIDMNLDFYTVIYDYNDGTGKTDSITVGNVTLTEPSNPVLSGHSFDGWYIGAESGGNVTLTAPWNFGNKVSEKTTLYAKWTATATPTVAPTAKPTATPDVGRTCQDDGYPEGYYWSESAQACVIDKVIVVPTAKPTIRPTVAPTKNPTITATPDENNSVVVVEKPNTQKPTAESTVDPNATNQGASDKIEMDTKGSWSLVTVMATLGTLILSIVLIVMKKEDEENENDKLVLYKRNKGMMWGAIALSIISVVIVVLTQSFTQPMVWLDSYSLLMVLIMIITVCLLYLGSRWKEVE